MTTYCDPHIRGIALRHLGEVVDDPCGGPAYRYAQVVGILSALLADDKEMVEAIKAACHGPREEAGKDDLPERAREAGAV